MLCELDTPVREENVERLRRYTSHLMLDVLALRRELHAQLERARLEQERLLDMLDRARPHLAATVVEEDLRALLAEIGDVLTGRR
jgi:hypothetical protein